MTGLVNIECEVTYCRLLGSSYKVAVVVAALVVALAVVLVVIIPRVRAVARLAEGERHRVKVDRPRREHQRSFAVIHRRSLIVPRITCSDDEIN